MRELAANGVTPALLADKYSYSISAISLILRGLRRKRAGGPIKIKKSKRDTNND